ncbi:PPC domain-containing protein [Deinococcus apachensis]|uniref:PPC domain-containing protein n=1 Tax=Deinococcus apachensis TaxID=309886 RepID=UPI00036CA4BA|nr:PPC domain-containing protein [Deinococcus apachensis]
MYTPNPILVVATGPDGLTVEVTAERGDLAGYVLLGQQGPSCTVEVSVDGGSTWQVVTYPHTLASGLLRLTRPDPGGAVTTLRALAPLDEGAAPEPPADDHTLQNGVPVTGITAFTGPSSSVTPTYSALIPPGTASLTVSISGGTGSRDIIGRYGAPDAPPEINAAEDPPSTEHTFTLQGPQPGTWFISVSAGFGETVEGATLTATWQ